MRFYTADLLSKWGFDDGDLIDNFLQSHQFPIDIIDTTPLWQRVFAELVLPAIENEIEFAWEPSMHNSALAKTVDGVKVGRSADRHSEIHIRPEYVDVPDDDILRWANELRAPYLAMPLSAIREGMASGNDAQAEEAFVALRLHGIRPEDGELMEATCTDKRLDEFLRRQIKFALDDAKHERILCVLRQRLLARPDMTKEEFQAHLPDCDPVMMVKTREAVSRYLSVPACKIRPTDSFRDDLHLKSVAIIARVPLLHVLVTRNVDAPSHSLQNGFMTVHGPGGFNDPKCTFCFNDVDSFADLAAEIERVLGETDDGVSNSNDVQSVSPNGS